MEREERDGAAPVGPAAPPLVDGLDVLVDGFFQSGIVADRHYRQGMELQSRGQWERALRSFRSACAFHPRKALYLLARGRLCQAHGLEGEAGACYALAREIDPADPVALFNEADLLARRGEVGRAAANLRALLALPSDATGDRAATAWRLLGDLEFANGDHRSAIDAYRQGLLLAPGDRYLATMAASEARLRDVVADVETAPRVGRDGLEIPPKASAYAFAGAMLLGLPGDDGIDVPRYPGLGFVSVAEVAEALARPLALLRRRHVPFATVRAVEDEAAPVAHALAVALGARSCPRYGGDGPEAEASRPGGLPELRVSLVGDDPDRLRRVGAGREDWVLCLGLRHPAWRYAGAIDAALVDAEVEVPWASGDARARAPEGDAATALADALARVTPADALIDRHLEWHRVRPRLRSGDPGATFAARRFC